MPILHRYFKTQGLHFEIAMLISNFLTVLILPINAFGSGQAHSNSGSPEENTALVQHLFRGSWKVDHPRTEAKEPQEQSSTPLGHTVPSEISSEDG